MENIKVGVEVKEGYMGCNAYIGRNYKGYMRYSEINKIVKSEFKKKFKDVKVSCKGTSFSGGQECNGTIMMKLNEAIKTLDEFKAGIDKYYETNHYCFNPMRYLNNWDCDYDNVSYDESVEILYDKYVRLLKAGMRMDRVGEVEEMLLSEKAVESVKYLNDLYDSFNYDECNGMVDYFNVMFYKSVELKAVDEL